MCDEREKAKIERLSHCDNAACGTVESAESVPSYSAVTSSWVTAGVAECHGKQKKKVCCILMVLLAVILLSAIYM